jgi:hypothetical protein
MQFDIQAVREQQRLAYSALINPYIADSKDKNAREITHGGVTFMGIDNPFYSDPTNINIPAYFQQELPWDNGTNNYVFDFSLKAPAASATLNNVNISKNQVAALYGLAFYFGVGATANTRNYQTFGPAPNDNAFYNSIVQLQIEKSTEVDLLDGKDFLDRFIVGNSFTGYSGVQLLNPIRLISGELGRLQVQVNLINSIKGVPITPNCFIACKPLIALGQASGKMS